jgi:hypothetical protein
MDEETQVQVLSVLSINFLTFITGQHLWNRPKSGVVWAGGRGLAAAELRRLRARQHGRGDPGAAPLRTQHQLPHLHYRSAAFWNGPKSGAFWAGGRGLAAAELRRLCARQHGRGDPGAGPLRTQHQLPHLHYRSAAFGNGPKSGVFWNGPKSRAFWNYAVSVYANMDEETQVQVLSVLSINFLTFITGQQHSGTLSLRYSGTDLSPG